MRDTIRTPTRRTVLRTIPATLAVCGLAGCISGSGRDTGSERDPDESYVDTEPEYDGWLADANDYQGTVDRRGHAEVVVDVGAGSRGMAFAPAAVIVSPGTTIRWEWTGEGGTHNVRHEDGQFESEYASSAGHVFTHSLDATGVYKYVCEPHRSTGMKGAVTVADTAETG